MPGRPDRDHIGANRRPNRIDAGEVAVGEASETIRHLILTSIFRNLLFRRCYRASIHELTVIA
jgi:hypothetical protein